MSAQKPTTAEAVAYLRKWHLPKRTFPCKCPACVEDVDIFTFTVEQLQRVDALEAELAEMKALAEGLSDVVAGRVQPLAAIRSEQAELARLREALEQYANAENWNGGAFIYDFRDEHWQMYGESAGPELAQRALAGRGDAES